jgi:microcystin-dependent protein
MNAIAGRKGQGRSRLKRATLIGLSIAITLGAATAGYASGLIKWSAGQTLTAADLNSNFSLLQDQITQLQQQAVVPSGTVVPFAGPAVPSGWLKCDGMAVSRTTYAGLFQVIGTIHGAGDGATTFNVPDYRGLFLRGVDEGAQRDPDAATRTAPNVGGNVGNLVGSIEKASFASHSHGLTDPGHTHAVNDPGHTHGVNDPGHAHGVSDPGHAHNFTFGAGAGGSGNITDYFRDAGFNIARGTESALTGISIQASATGLTIQSGATGLSLKSASTGATIQSSGGSETRPINAAVIYIIKA